MYNTNNSNKSQQADLLLQGVLDMHLGSTFLSHHWVFLGHNMSSEFVDSGGLQITSSYWKSVWDEPRICFVSESRIWMTTSLVIRIKIAPWFFHQSLGRTTFSWILAISINKYQWVSPPLNIVEILWLLIPTST